MLSSAYVVTLDARCEVTRREIRFRINFRELASAMSNAPHNRVGNIALVSENHLPKSFADTSEITSGGAASTTCGIVVVGIGVLVGVLVGVVVGVVDESSARTTRRWLVLKRGWHVMSVRVATCGVLASTDVLSGATTETSLTV